MSQNPESVPPERPAQRAGICLERALQTLAPAASAGVSLTPYRGQA